jgi:hypothetical protein
LPHLPDRLEYHFVIDSNIELRRYIPRENANKSASHSVPKTVSSHPSQPEKLWLSKIPFWTIALLFLAGTAYRWAFLQDASEMINCDSCLLKQSVVHEVQFLLAAFALHQLSI